MKAKIPLNKFASVATDGAPAIGGKKCRINCTYKR